MKKKNVKLVACLSLTGFLALCGLPYINNSNYNIGIMETQAAEITNTWESGNTTVTLDSEGTLTVTAKAGTDGRMGDHGNKTPEWSTKVINNLIIEEGVTYVGYETFRNIGDYYKVESLSLPSTLKKINNYNFYGFDNLKELTLPDGEVDIESTCFEKSKKDLIVHIPKNFKNIGKYGMGFYTTGEITFDIADGSIYQFNNNVLFDTEDYKVLYMKEGSIIPQTAKEILSQVGYILNYTVEIPENVEILNKYMFNTYSLDKYNKNSKILIHNSDITLNDFIAKNYFTKYRESGYEDNINIYTIPNSNTWTKLSAYNNIYDIANLHIWVSGDISINLNELNGRMDVRGNGSMIDYSSPENTPWYGKTIKKVFIEPTVTYIGANSFQNMTDIVIDDYPGQTNDYIIKYKISIGDSAFKGSNILFSLGLSYSNLNGVFLDKVGNSAFEGTTIDFDNNSVPGLYLCGNIGSKAFKDVNFSKGELFFYNEKIEEVASDAFDSPIKFLYFRNKDNYSRIDYIPFSDGVLENIEALTFYNTGLNMYKIDYLDWSNLKLLWTGSTYYPFINNADINTLKIKRAYGLIDTNSKIENLWYGSDNPSTSANVLNLYWDYKGAIASVNIDSGTKIYVHKDSPAETWCKNNSRDYDYITDEMINGKRPIINQFNLSFDKQNPSDLHFDFDLGSDKLGAKSIKNIIINGKKLVKDTDFVISDSIVTLKKEIFEILINDTYNVTVIFDNDYTIDDKVKVIVYGEDVILTPENTVPQQYATYNNENPKDISFKVYCESIDSIIINNKELDTNDYILAEYRTANINNPKLLTIKKEVLNTLKTGEYEIIVVTDAVMIRNKLSIFVTNKNNEDNTQPPIILDTVKYEFYKDYPDFIVIPFSFNRANSITEVKIGSNILDSTHYNVVDSTIIIDKDYLSTLDIGKYVVSVTFDDNTKRSNAQLIVYEKAADRAAPYLLQSHIIFNGNSINLTFDPGEGDLQTTNVLALVIDDKLILPNGDKVDFSSNNINKLQKAYKDYINEEEIEVASPSNAKKEETNINNNENIDSEDTNIKEDESIDNKNNDSENTNINEDESINNENDKTNINDTKETNTNKDNIDNEDTDISKDETIYNKDNETNINNSEETNTNEKETINNEDNETNINNKEEDNLIKVDVEQVESNSFNLFATLDDYDKVFVTNGTEIVLDGAYIESLNLSEGDHLIGAIFDNTERTTDVKKVILTIPKTDNGDKPTPPDDGDKEEPVNPTPKPDEGNNKPTPDDNNNNNGGGSSGGGSSSGGSSGNNSKPDNSKPSPINPDGSLNPDYKPVVPDTGGKFEGNGDDWTYIKPDGNQAKNEWVGDGKDWYYIDENSKLKYDWALINNEWYMLNREHDGKFGAAKYGWYKESQDGQWYFMNPSNTKMLTGWQKINQKWYYFNVNKEGPTYYGDNQSGWKYDTTKGIRPHGSMYANEITPDGYKTNEKGEWIE